MISGASEGADGTSSACPRFALVHLATPRSPAAKFFMSLLGGIAPYAARTPSSPLPPYPILKTRVTCRGAVACAPMSPTFAGVQLQQFFLRRECG